MRIVFSRKGFDSQYGRVASPILPDGTMFSLPIPVPGDPHQLGDLRPGGHDLAGIVADLTRGNVVASMPIHLDPDLDVSTIARPPGWRPAFGQTAAAQAHLENQGIGPGDLFLFFGWFREVEHAGGTWRYRRSAPDIHALFGWLQVEERVTVGNDASAAVQRHPWLAGHPHIVGAASYSSSNNSIYVGRKVLRLAGKDLEIPGAGVLSRFRRDLQLTAPGRTRSWWRLPAWFHPRAGRPVLSYHTDPKRWSLEAESTTLRIVDKGQEFVLDTAQYPEAISWVAKLLRGPT